MEKLGEVDDYIDLYKKIYTKLVNAEKTNAVFQEICKSLRCAYLTERENNGNPRVVDEDAPASEKQLSYLKRLGVVVDEEITKGQASDLIEEAKAEKSDKK